MSYVSTDIKKIIAEIIENKKEKGGVKNIYFVGCGGSLGALYPNAKGVKKEKTEEKDAGSKAAES